MRKLKLQMSMSLDGSVTETKGATSFKWSDELRSFSTENLIDVDDILLGRKTAEDFIPYWAEVATNPADSDHEFGKLLTDIPKIVFSNELKTGKWQNATIVKGDIVEEINALKNKKGKDIIVYGGISFVTSLIEHELIDEFYLLVNPFAVGNEQSIFKSLKDDLQLTLEKCEPFACGTVLLCYSRQK